MPMLRLMDDKEMDPYARSDSLFGDGDNSGRFTGSLAGAYNRSSIFARYSARNAHSKSFRFSELMTGNLVSNSNSATIYDRKGTNANMQAQKSRKQTYIENAMRELYIMFMAQKHMFVCLADYEVLMGYKQFCRMLEFDNDSHEAMFGLGKLNYMIKRYEIAERWFCRAIEVKSNHVYKAWLGFTYAQMSFLLSDQNPKKQKFSQYAIRNLTKCIKDKYLGFFTCLGLLDLSIK
jgi:hypothetical protein